VYTKDLASLLQLLSVSGQSGVLHLEPLEPVGGREAWHAQLILAAGEIIACDVLSKIDGRVLLGGPEALQRLTDMGALTWSLEEEPEVATYLRPFSQPAAGRSLQEPSKTAGSSSDPVPNIGSSPGPSPTQPYMPDLAATGPVGRPVPPSFAQRRPSGVLIPRRPVRGEHTVVDSSWPREHRLVLALVDGHRTADEIAALIHKTPVVVAQVISDLESMGFVERA
jgi:hypothetical protein